MSLSNAWALSTETLMVFGQGLQVTLSLFVIAGSLGLVFGCLLALAKTRYIPKLFGVSWLFIELCRGIPLLVILFIIYYGFQLPSYWAGVFALTAWATAFIAEALRPTIENMCPAQLKSAKVLGMSRMQLIRYVVLPQAIVQSLPILANQYINLAKNTSIVYFIGLLDITYAFELLSAKYFLFFQFFLVSLGLYMSMSFLILTAFKYMGTLVGGPTAPQRTLVKPGAHQT